MSGWEWCEHCRDHFEIGHYTKAGNHRVGAKYGPVGRDMADLRALPKLYARISELEAENARLRELNLQARVWLNIAHDERAKLIGDDGGPAGEPHQ